MLVSAAKSVMSAEAIFVSPVSTVSAESSPALASAVQAGLGAMGEMAELVERLCAQGEEERADLALLLAELGRQRAHVASLRAWVDAHRLQRLALRQNGTPPPPPPSSSLLLPPPTLL